MKYYLLLTAVVVSFTLQSLSLSGQIILRPSSYIPFRTTDFVPAPDGGAINLIKLENYRKGSGWNRARYAITLEKYNKQFNKVLQNTLIGGDGFSTAFFTILKYADNRVWLVYTEPAEGSTIGSIKAVEINPETLQTAETIVLATESEIALKVKVQALNELKIYFESSPDNNYYSLFVNGGDEECFIAGFDNKFKSLWKKRYTHADFKKNQTVTFSVTNKGETIIASANKETPVISIADKQGKLVNTSPSFGEFNPTDIAVLDGDDKQGLTIAGLYAKESDNVSGVFRAILSTNNYKVEKLITSDIPEIIIERLKKDGFASTKSKRFGIPRFYLTNNFYKLTEGTWIQVLECKHFLGGDRVRGIGVGSLITAAFSENGAAYSHIPRYAVIPTSEKKDEYTVSNCKDELILFYKDEASNLDKKLEDNQTVLKGEKNAVLVAAHVNSKGNITKRVRAGNSDNNISGIINTYITGACRTP